MPIFSDHSLNQLKTCHNDLQVIFNEVIKYFDCKILEGFRDELAQNKAYAEGKSKLKWPNGKHNQMPSYALDAIPCPIDWKDRERIIYFAGYVMGIAKQLKAQGKISHDLIWGGDWNNNTQVKDNTFDDLVHFELVRK